MTPTTTSHDFKTIGEAAVEPTIETEQAATFDGPVDLADLLIDRRRPCTALDGQATQP